MFKPKQLTLILAAALLLGACGNNDNLLPDVDNPQQQVPLPIIAAQIGGDADTRTGVVEDNENYVKGEQFHWTDGDEVSIKLYQGTTVAKTLTYVAGSIDADTPNLCTFTTTGTATAGTYNLLGLYPTTLSVNSDSPTSIIDLTQTGNKSSSHLNGQLLMKGKVFSAALTTTPAELSMRFNHLTSVVRYVVTNNTGSANLKVSSLKLESNNTPFVSKAYLNDINAQTLTPTTNTTAATLSVTDGAFSTTDNTFHGFTRVVTGSSAITDLSVSIGIDNNGQIGVLSKTIPSASLTDVLGQGFKPGHSYYFHLGINSGMGLEVSSVSEWVGMDVEPTEGQADEGVLYKIGDYYPDPADPTTAIGVVFWVNPNNNRHGKIVSLDEGSNAWGPSSSTTNATSLYNGMANMNTVYTRYPGYANYPAFAWVHAKNGGGLTNYYTEVTTGVWYLPAVEEMRMLTVGYCGKAYEDVANWAADIGMPDWSDTECANARSAFDNKLKAAGGSVLNSDNKYWTSTESDFFDAFRCTTEGTYANVPKSNSYSIRAFYSF